MIEEREIKSKNCILSFPFSRQYLGRFYYSCSTGWRKTYEALATNCIYIALAMFCMGCQPLSQVFTSSEGEAIIKGGAHIGKGLATGNVFEVGAGVAGIAGVVWAKLSKRPKDKKAEKEKLEKEKIEKIVLETMIK